MTVSEHTSRIGFVEASSGTRFRFDLTLFDHANTRVRLVATRVAQSWQARTHWSADSAVAGLPQDPADTLHSREDRACASAAASQTDCVPAQNGWMEVLR